MVGPMGDEDLLHVGIPADDQGMDPEAAIKFVSEVAALSLALQRFVALAEELYPHIKNLKVTLGPKDLGR